MNALEEWIVEDMIERLDEIEDLDGYEGYVCDLSYFLYEDDNHNGVITGYAYYDEAKEWINQFWGELKDEMEDYEFNFGEYPNPFENECAFMVKIILNAAGRLLFESEWIQENWNEEVTYTKEIIEKIKAELQEVIAD